MNNMTTKRLVYENTHYSLLLYLLYDKSWESRNYLLYGNRFDTQFINRFSKHVKNCNFESSSRFCFRKSPVKYYLNRLKEIIRFRWVNEVYGNVNTFHSPFKRIIRNVVEDGLGTKVEINNHAKGIYPYKFKEVIKLRQPIRYIGPNRYIVSKGLLDEHDHKLDVEVIDINSAWDALDDSSKEKLISIFVGNNDLVKSAVGGSFLLLTQPFDNDGLMTESDKVKGYKSVISELQIDEESLFIKPHPRETSDYKSIFPKATIMDGNIPFEFFNFLNVKFENVITITSSSVFHINNGANVIFLGTSEHFTWPIDCHRFESINYEKQNINNNTSVQR